MMLVDEQRRAEKEPRTPPWCTSPKRYRDTSLMIHRHWRKSGLQAFPTVATYQPSQPTTPSPPPSTVHTATGDAPPRTHSRQKQVTMTEGTRPRTRARDHGMDLSYVTERIIALWFPGDISPSSFRQGQQQAAHMLTSKHGNSYMVFNLSEPRRAARSQHERVRELGWPPDLAPPLERLCSICKDIDSWLSGDNHRIAVLHARGSQERIGVVVAAYMHYSNICGSADQALDRFAMKRYLDDKIGDLDQPSHKRYIDYFSGLLSGNIRINTNPLYLTHVTVLGAPSFEVDGGSRAFLKVYEGLVPVYTSGVHSVSGDTKQFTVNVAGDRRRGLQLRGDILLKCYHRHYSADLDSPSRSSSPNDSDILPARELIFSCQFHTCAVSDYTLSFTRQELDHAWNDLRFPLDGAVELHFSATPDGVRFPLPAPTPAVPVDTTPDSVTRWDSYENLLPETDMEDVHDGEVAHTYGPLDGSLYATVRTKKEGVSPAGVQAPVISSVHTVSMDSGISSAGNGLLQPTASYPDHHRQLDELLSDMLLTVENIPDLPGEGVPPREGREGVAVECGTPRAPDADIPYHARQDSRPFTYGVPSPPPSQDMLRAQTGLSSPSLVRKASFKGFAERERENVNGSVPIPHRDVRRSNSSLSVPTSRSPDFHEGTIVSGSISHHSSNNLTWLQRQQQKLRERRDVQLRSERLPHETRLLSELRTVQTGQYRSHRPSPSQRLDGYTSDTTLFADEDDEDFTIPLHINTTTSKTTNGSSAPVSPLLPHRTSSRRNYSNSTSTSHFNTISNSTMGRQKSESSFDRERPFVAVKRSHEQSRKYSDSTSPDSLPGLSTPDSGLLVEAERQRLNGFNNGVGNGTGGDALASLMATLAASSSPPSNGSDTTNSTAWSPSHTQLRDESYSSWRTTSLSEDTGVGGSPPHSGSPRPQTPAFPVHPRTPYINSSSTQFDTLTSALPPKSPTAQRKEWSPMSETLTRDHREHSVSSFRGYESDSHTQHSPKGHLYSSGHNGTINGGQSSPSVYYGHSRRSSIHSNGEPPTEVSPAHVKFVRDTSRFWYKPTISREEAILMLKDRPPGTFVVRDSNSFPNAFGLALKVATPPPSTPGKAPSSSDPSTELVRHFLIEPTSRGVRLKGCANEPVFSSLSALVYQHSLMPLALPCKLTLPEADTKLPSESSSSASSAQQLLAQGAACNVLYLLTIDTESLTGPQAIIRAVGELFSKPLPPAAIVHFKVSSQGITLTDNKRQLFFRRHYPVASISYCGLDPDDRRWTQRNEAGMPISSNRCFGFVARKPASKTDNQCHIFAELEPEQPATAIVNFVSKVMMNSCQGKSNMV